MYLLRPCLAAVLGVALGSAQIAILQIQVIEGEGAVHVPGSRSTRPVTVEVTDETGKPVANAAVSFLAPEDGPSGSFLNGLRTTVATTDARGRVSVSGLQANRSPGRFQLRIVASKEQARAGIVSFQYVAVPTGPARPVRSIVRSDPDPATPAPVVRPPASSRSKWLMILTLAGGGAIAGVIAAGRSKGAVQAPAAVIQPPTLSIGSPTVSVGKQ